MQYACMYVCVSMCVNMYSNIQHFYANQRRSDTGVNIYIYMEPSRKKKSSHRDLFESGVYFDGEGNFGKNPSA